MNLLDFFKEYLLTRDTPPSKATVKNYLADIRKFILWFEERYQRTFDPSAVTGKTIELYKNEKLARIRRGTSTISSVNSVDRYLSSLRKFFGCLKQNGLTSTSPFDMLNRPDQAREIDEFHIKTFKNYLQVNNNSTLTIKNYIIDVRQFLTWVKQVSKSGPSYLVASGSILEHIRGSMIEEYKNRLLNEAQLSPLSINRKLSAIRKYLYFAYDERLINEIPLVTQNLQEEKGVNDDLMQSEVVTTPVPAAREYDLETAGAFDLSEEKEKKNRTYSKFPPLRMLQKMGVLGSILFDIALIAPIVLGYEKLQYAVWILSGRKIFSTLSSKAIDSLPGNSSHLLRPDPIAKFVGNVPNFKKSFYAPYAISTLGLPFHKKLWHHMKHTRPKWYKRYHSFPLVHYMHFAALVIFMSAIGFGIYQSYWISPQEREPVLAAAVSPPRILSFQGRLTDSSDNPITANSNLRFAIYNNQSASGSALLWQEIQNVTPDQDGIFSVILGDTSGIPQSVFGQNAALFLGITVGRDPELVPRQQIASVAYATNAELLQGMPAITQPNAGTSNVILALDSSGNLTIGGTASPTFQATGGALTLSGSVLNLLTTTGSNSNVVIRPDGTGFVDMQKAMQNTTGNGQLVAGAVEVDDMFAVLANNSGQAAVTIGQSGSGPIINASSSSGMKFQVNNEGTGFFAGSVGINELNPSSKLYINSGGDSSTVTLNTSAGSTAVFNLLANGTQYAAMNRNGNGDVQWTTASGVDYIFSPGGNVGIGTTVPGSFALQVAGNIGPNTDSSNDLGSSSSKWNALYVNTANTANSSVSGTLTLSGLTSNGGVLYGNGSGAVSQTATGAVGECLTSNGGSGGPTWAACTAIGGTNWDVANGTIYPKLANTLDLLVGGTSTASADFAVLNTTSGTSTTYVAGNIGVGTTTPGENVDVIGTIRASGLITANGGLTIGAAQSLTLNSDTITDLVGTGLELTGTALGTTLGTDVDLTTEVTGILPIANGGTNSTATPTLGGIAYGTGTEYAFTSSGTNGYVLTSTGTGAPDWTDPTTLGTNYWQQSNGAVSPINISNDLLLGSNATSSALVKLGGTTNSTTYFNTGGNVGIGTTNPTTFKLEVAGHVGPLVDSTYDLGTTGVRWRNGYFDTLFGDGSNLTGVVASSANAVGFNNITTGTNTTAAMTLGSGSSLSAATGVTLTGDAGSTFDINGDLSIADTSIAFDGASTNFLATGNFSVNSNDLFIQKSSGNVGIGTTGPTANLDIVGDASLSGSLVFNSSSSQSIDVMGGKTLSFNTSPGGDAGLATKMVLKSDGTVGIGTGAPIGQLHINSSAANSNKTLVLSSAGTTDFDPTDTSIANLGGLLIHTTQIPGVDNPVNLVATGSDAGNYGSSMRFWTRPLGAGSDPLERMRILESGNIGIGTTSPSDMIHVDGGTGAGRLRLEGDTSAAIRQAVTSLTGTGRWSTYVHNGTGDYIIGTGTDDFGSINGIFAIQHADGNVGIGITTPGAKLHVVGNIAASSSITGAALGISTTAFVGTTLTVGNYLDVNGEVELNMQSIGSNALCHSTGNNNSVIRDCAGAPQADYAEMFPVAQGIEYGDIVVPGTETVEEYDVQGNDAVTPATPKRTITKLVKSTQPYAANAIGIVVNNRGDFTSTGHGIINDEDNPMPVALNGRVPVKVTTKNGTIQTGDYITTSSLPGVGMKATKAGYVIGKALVPYTNPDPEAVGTVLVFVNNTFYDPEIYITDTGDLHISQTENSDFEVTRNGETVDRVGAFKEAIIGAIEAGVINATQVSAESITIAGMSLRDYILSVVSQIEPETPIIVSPVDGKLAVSVLSPLGEDPEISLTLDKSELAVKNKAGQKVAGIDNEGNATFSGTLKANRIEADEVELSEAALAKLRDEIGATSSATTINNITNIYTTASGSANPTPSPTQAASPSATPTPGTISISPTPPIETPDAQTEYADMASMSGVLGYVPNFKADFATFTEGLISLGPASLNDVSIAGQLAINGNMLIGSNSINVLGADLEIQPLRQGNVSFMGGLVKIDIDGNLSVEGNATFAKNVAIKGILNANVISPVPDQDLVIELPEIRSVDQYGNIALRQSDLIVKNASGSGVLRINQLGDIIASGSGNFKNIASEALKIVRGAQADTSLTETVATASAGTAVINRNQQERTIFSPYVREDSLIYITPTSDTAGLTPYVARQTPENKEEGKAGSFTIQVPEEASVDIKVNWWIIN